MAVGPGKRNVTRSWISDTPDEVEHPPVPLGINEMAVPRAAILLSISTVLVILLSSIWIGFSAVGFLEKLDESFESVDESMIEMDGRWAWEVDLLFDTCDSRDGDWTWPDNLSSQDEVFLYPGELRCDWEHQGQGDRASVVIYNRGNQTLDLLLEIGGPDVLFSASGDTQYLINEMSGGDAVILEIELTEDITEGEISIIASHVSLMSAEVRLDVSIFQGIEARSLHIEEGDRVEVEYTVWNADTGEELDSGTWTENAGDPWWSIDGFGWSTIGLDIDDDRGLIPGVETGTSHITLLPPPIAYGNNDGHELQDVWLRFEVNLDRAPISG
ncbi:MAG: hypothetical protein CMA62_05230 [Euryarchaeota archaeon]|nr:hypothetical protein [Euryarchaeota archaeon]MBT86897.1 hypothetical protein [Euryarchaeota archaeon]DAC47678.1 MAG TPA: hypothetical protein D7H82_01315 [Candidatus Poseidoniales archaeon]HII33521.1 hypothetical protein [Candidatus Thalassarchaeaceae archaeon]|tara:strand:- start:318 stop:1304 length:987 start_codon:yes stop_codon:yes gene_type:complete